MRKIFFLFLILVSFIDAKEYLSHSVGYMLESSKIEHDRINYNPAVYNYAYRLNSVYLTQNYVVLSDIEYYPMQNFAKGYQQDGDRFTSDIERLSLYLQAGLKKYIIPYTYFVPTIGVRYVMDKSHYKIPAQYYSQKRENTEFDIPLDLNIGYSLTPTSDILFGFNIDEDLSDLKIHDYQEYMIKYYVSFRTNITINALYSKISKINSDDSRQVTDQYSLTLGLRF